MSHPVIQELEKSQMKKATWDFKVGDTVEVRTKVKEGDKERAKGKEGDKERISVFIGTVIAKGGTGLRANFTVRRLVQGEGVERTFPMHNPTLVDVRVRHKGEVRRAKLFYLRDRMGKATRIKGRTVHSVAGDESTETPAADAKPAEAKADAKPEAKKEGK